MDENPSFPHATRKDVQLGRRLFHMGSGLIVALAYGLLFTHSQAVHLLGTIACVAYVFDKIRVAYPETAQKLQGLTNFFIRAEERLSESSAIPYVISILLTIISFPKPIALMAICILAIADPLSAIVGIQYGKRHLVPDKTLEGSVAFFGAAFACSFFILVRVAQVYWLPALGVSVLISLAVTMFEMIPTKLDDNLTIPLFVGFISWALCGIFGVNV